MFATSQDLFMSLAGGFILLVIFCVFLFMDFDFERCLKVVDDVAEIVERVHKTIVEPLRALDYLIDKLDLYVGNFVEGAEGEEEEVKEAIEIIGKW